MDELNRYFIELEGEIDPALEQSAAYVRKSIFLERPIKKAEIIMTALGIYTGFINGKRLGRQRLTPGYTDYGYRVQYQAYDVTDELEPGENVIAAIVGDGWYRGCIDIGSVRNAYGTKTKFCCLFTVEYKDGTSERFATDDSWSISQEGMLRKNNLKTIERADARKELAGWNLPGYSEEEHSDAGWHKGKISFYSGSVIPQEGELVLEHEQFTPSVLHTPDGNTVLDMGQNFGGHVRFRVKGKADHKVSLTMGECLDEQGNFTLKNLIAEGAASISGEVGQKLEYILRDGMQEYEPEFLISGFRYVLVENWPEDIKPENFTGVAVYSDIPFTGTFTCSNPLVNRLVENVRWSQKGNFVDIPADCPTRERSGWTADMSVFSETACYLSNPRAFLKKWFQDYKAEQSEDGNLPFVVPGAGKKKRQRGCLGWSNAICNITMNLYKFYGYKEDLEDVYDCVRRYVDFNVERAKEKNPFFFFKRRKNRDYIVETGFHYGEWLEPGRPMYKDYIKDLFFPDTEVTTAWFYQTAKQLAQMARILEKDEDYSKYRELAKQLYRVYHEEFVPHGRIRSKRHCRYVRPLSMHLLSGKEKEQAAAQLNALCEANEYRIGTGFLTTWTLLQVLTENGYTETAYRMLENTKQPGWLYAVTKGATTTWENWGGIDETGKPVDSHNHFAPGAAVAWLFSTCAGITPAAPGFTRIRIRPIPGGTMEYAACSYESIQGRIVSEWKKKDGFFRLHVEVPEQIPAEVILPDGTSYEMTGGKADYEIRI